MRKAALAIAIAAIALLPAGAANAGPVLDAVKARGELVCGVRGDSLGFAHPLADGKYVGFAVDICRAIGVAILGDAAKVKFVPLAADKRFAALKAGEVDVLVSGTTHTMNRELEHDFDFVATYLYDGQGFMVPRKLGKRSLKDLADVSICVTAGTTTERNLADYFRRNNKPYKPVPFGKVEDLRAAFFGGKCDAYTGDATALFAARAAYAPIPQEYIVLPELISKEPLAVIVRDGDPAFAAIARWAFLAMIQAEEAGITSANVDQMAKSDSPEIKLLLGTTPGIGKVLGLDDKWIYRIVKLVGNYGESYERNLGRASQLKIPRGLNALWTQGGMQYSPPFR